MKLNNKVYDVLKWVAILLLPALSTFVSVFCETWNLPYGPQLSTTITAFGVFLGAVLGLSNLQYKKSKKGEV